MRKRLLRGWPGRNPPHHPRGRTARPSTGLSTLDAEEANHRRQAPPIRAAEADPSGPRRPGLDRDEVPGEGPERRYETANGLAVDIQRHLDNEPVVARPPSKLYRFRKTGSAEQAGLRCCQCRGCRAGPRIRHFHLVVLQRATSPPASRNRKTASRSQRKIAEGEAAKSQQVARFLKDMLAGVGPSVARGGTQRCCGRSWTRRLSGWAKT